MSLLWLFFFYFFFIIIIIKYICQQMYLFTILKKLFNYI